LSPYSFPASSGTCPEHTASHLPLRKLDIIQRGTLRIALIGILTAAVIHRLITSFELALFFEHQPSGVLRLNHLCLPGEHNFSNATQYISLQFLFETWKSSFWSNHLREYLCFLSQSPRLSRHMKQSCWIEVGSASRQRTSFNSPIMQRRP
jgi:hypothetical protein